MPQLAQAVRRADPDLALFDIQTMNARAELSWSKHSFQTTLLVIIAAIALISESTALRDKLEANTERFRAGMTAAGLSIRPGTHPITPVMLGDAKLAVEMAQRMLTHGIYVIGFAFPVVPRGQARIRVQLSAAHSTEDVDRAVSAFATVGKELGVVAGTPSAGGDR